MFSPYPGRTCTVVNDRIFPVCGRIRSFTESVTVNNHNMVVNEVDNPSEQQQRIKKKRSIQAKQKKNRKRNNQSRSIRFRYYLTRPFYYKFKSRTIRRILRQYGIQFRHIKKRYDRVIIGVKSDQARRDYEETLPYDCFSKKNYEMFR